MKNKLIQHIFRKIKNNYKRFISLLCMSLLGVGFYAGIKATSPDMIKTLDTFFDSQEVYDIEIVSTLGLTENDITELEKIPNINKVVGSTYKDVFTNIEKEEYIIRLLPIMDDINKLHLVEGRMPNKDNEILVEESFLEKGNYKIGDSISILSSTKEENKFEIVGVAISPLYFSNNTNRGTTTLGGGTINYFAYVNNDILKDEYYTNIYITVDNAKEKVTFSDEYNNLINKVISNIEQIKEEREKERYNELYGTTIANANNHNIPIDTSKFDSPVWYIWDRTENVGYKNLTDASTNIQKLGNVFPLVFYIIAVLISLISMKRMIEEDRTENGTLKALGFNNLQITMKYIVYSTLATVLGGLIGMLIGFNLIPRVIWNIYQLIFTIPNFICEFNFSTALVGLSIALICITGTAIVVSYKNLREVPANLMRPKAPKIGKKIFLEYIKILWKKLKFSNKITIRNIFRYKGRVMATIIGISGCTALILSGFGLKDSISDIANFQFNKVFHYDKLVALKENVDYTNMYKYLDNSSDVKDIVNLNMENVDLLKEEEKQDGTLIVADNIKELEKVLSLKDINNGEQVKLNNNSVVITDKLSQLFNLEIGDNITITNDSGKKVNVNITNIIENYVNNYVIINKYLYEKIFDEYKTNTIMLNMNKISEKENKEFDKYLINQNDVASIMNIEDAVKEITDMMDKLNSVVIILIVSSALLAFVVLYNLSNINISERKREIATLKVLGFYNKEVDDYITKENLILTIIGISIGLFAGLYLCHYIISTCEPDYIMFVRHINIKSYIYATIITALFTIIVNIITHFNLKKIDMIESLKNIE